MRAAALDAPLSPWHRLVWSPTLTLVLAAVVYNLAGWLVDGSSLEQPEALWGYAFAAAATTLLYGVPVLFVTLLAGLAGNLSRSPRAAQVWTWVGAAATAGAGVVVVVFGFENVDSDAASQAFAVVSLVVGAGLLVPLIRAQSLRRRT